MTQIILPQQDTFGTFTEGYIPFGYNGEHFETYYKIYGTLEDRTRNPLVIFHAGPGLVHNYLGPMADLVKTHNIPVILYDQLGNGRSTHLKGKPKEFWTIDVFMDQMDSLIQYLGIGESFDLLGHSSWGGICGSEYAVRKQPPGLKHLVLANATPSMDLWVQSMLQLLKEFPPEIEEDIKGGFKNPAAYYKALQIFQAKHACIVKPWPTDIVETMEAVFGPEGDITVSSAGQVSFVTPSGLRTNWTIIERLHTIKVPTLVVNGALDIAQDFIPKAKWIRFEDGSAMPMWEDRERFIQILGDFLTADLD
ncbi:hypothetical protein Clacol_006899 [Clathrus columnatus]|uniref:AB hydrolase-1 domain-containing protein n=1 Tax=Clathrus columnatus TaxID=1419009 RepID=A0AAV5AL53_9AGAM|nr:hypothetical protein Clacol_006899 [Clathrus columnatus]